MYRLILKSIIVYRLRQPLHILHHNDLETLNSVTQRKTTVLPFHILLLNILETIVNSVTQKHIPFFLFTNLQLNDLETVVN